jgi:hypothetical protein
LIEKNSSTNTSIQTTCKSRLEKIW